KKNMKYIYQTLIVITLITLSSTQTYNCPAYCGSLFSYYKYDPVCAVTFNSFNVQQKKFYMNECQACKTSNLIPTLFYAEGKCKDYKNFYLCDPDLQGNQICTKEYQPVCGYSFQIKTAITYGNRCQACSALGVYKYKLGKCSKFNFLDDIIRCDNDQISKICTADYNPVCGWADKKKIKCLRYPCASSYSNGCEACADKSVEYYTKGSCPGEPEIGPDDIFDQLQVPQEQKCPIKFVKSDVTTKADATVATGELNARPAQQVLMCTENDQPVCGLYNPKMRVCITTPCGETFKNKCDACDKDYVISFTDGPCNPRDQTTQNNNQGKV
ncbi:kazal-type serine protease inhibitor domain protein, partial [Ichthyophthirius multifiliis]